MYVLLTINFNSVTYTLYVECIKFCKLQTELLFCSSRIYMSCIESFFLIGCKDKMATMPTDIAKSNFKSWAVNTASIVAVIILIKFIINPMYGSNHNFLLLPEYMNYVHHKLDNIQEPEVLLQCVHSLNIPRFLQSCL